MSGVEIGDSSNETEHINSSNTPPRATILSQYKALLLRNIIIKKREKRKTLTEFLMPLYFILILAFMRMFIKDTVYPPISEPHDGVFLHSNHSSLLSKAILVTPDSPRVVELMDELQNFISFSPRDIIFLSSEQEMLEYYIEYQNASVALVFSDDPVKTLVYKIRINPKMFHLVPPETLTISGSQCRSEVPYGLESGFSCPSNSYYEIGFLDLQRAIDLTLIKLKSNESIPPAKLFLQSFPRNEYTSGGSTALRSVVPLYMVFAWSQFILYMMVLIVEEKEKRIKEGMKIMGLQGFVYWLSWVTIYFGYVILLAIICVIILPLSGVFKHANLFLIFILFILYGLSSILLALMLTTFFNNAKLAGSIGQLIQVAMSLLFYLQVYLSDRIATVAFWFLSLMSPCAFSFAVDKVMFFDFARGGLNWSNIWETEGGLPFAGSLIMISFDIILYLILGVYLDNVIPSEYGTKQKPWFIFQKSTWVKLKRHSERSFQTLASPNDVFEDDPLDEQDRPDIEAFPSNWDDRKAVRIRNLYKVFKQGTKEEVEAVAGISMDIFEGQITAILGHNGAGKTTLFNILTGMIAPSAGIVSIFNYDISNPSEMAEIRRLTGVCPQHDILFLKLTPKEHLSFYARIKGVNPSLIDQKVAEMLDDTDLSSKADTKAEDLSGGQKRKLSIGIALIGDPKLLFLDEPTAGVDAYSRRRLWTTLTKHKKGKVILLTTHFMDEADILADRKAIVSKGKLRCYGTSMFLKKKFGLGYHLTLGVLESCKDVESIKQLVKSVISEAEVTRHYGKELSFLLPSSSTSKFPQLFTILDQNITGTDAASVKVIERYGISMTTLEEVFIALNEENDSSWIGSNDNTSQYGIRLASPTRSLSSSPVESPDHNAAQSETQEGFRFEDVEVKKESFRTFKALVILRFLNMWRELASVIFLVLVPLLLVIVSIILSNGASVKFADDDPILLNADLYSSLENEVFIYNATGHSLPSLEDTLEESNLIPALYDGNYDYIYEHQSHFSAFDVLGDFQAGSLKNASTIRFNNTFAHSLPILINIISNTILKNVTKLESHDVVHDSSNEPRLTVYSQQLPLLESGKTEFNFGSYFSPVMIGYAFTIIPTGLVVDVIYDREINGQNMLRLNGVGFNMYFGSFLIVIGTIYLISYIGLLIIIQAFQVKSLVLPPVFATLSLLYFIYMPGLLLFSLCVSYLFNKSNTARQFFPSVAPFSGLISYTLVMILDLLKGSSVSRPVHFFFSIFVPFYIPYAALYFVSKVVIGCSISQTCDDLTFQDCMTPEIVCMFVVCVLDTFVFYFLLKVCDVLKHGGSIMDIFWKKTDLSPIPANKTYPESALLGDNDVKAERKKIASQLDNDFPALLHNVSKTYNESKMCGSFCSVTKQKSEFNAVKCLSLMVNPGEVFGLLGPNGAGKTSTIKIMTAEEAPSRGQVMVCGFNIASNLSTAYEYIGYCPQQDCLWKNITVQEHIKFLADINGVKEEQKEGLIDAYVKGLEITEHKNKKSKNCSGGTKRKLSYILSMIGRPRVVLLDEPSSGMDPQSKRFLWNSIHASFKGDRSSLLTTHSMEEAEFLCSRIGILVKGEFRCLGSVQHLKNKYGSGYSLEIKLHKESEEYIQSEEPDETENGFVGSSSLVRDIPHGENRSAWLRNLLRKVFPNSSIEEEFEERIVYKIPQSDVESLAQVFATLEELKEKSVVEEYVLSQTTLEQVFLRFARLQELKDEEADEPMRNEGRVSIN